MKRFIIFFSACFLLLAISTATIGYNTYSAFLEQKLISAARKTGMVLSFGGFSFSLPSIFINTPQVIYTGAKFPIQFDLQEASITPRYFSLLGEDPDINFTGKAYDGSFIGNIKLNKSKQKTSLVLAARELNLSQHPQIAGLGIKSGLFSTSIRQLTINPSTPEQVQGNFSILISDFSLVDDITLQPLITGLPLPVVVPKIEQGRLFSDVDLKSDSFSMNSISFISSLGKLSGNAEFELNNRNRITNFSVDTRIELSDEGSKVFGSYLPLLTNRKVPEYEKKIALKLSGLPFRFKLESL